MENEMTNPAVIMLINMTIVFAVLALLNLFIRLIHFIDPTKAKKAPVAAPKEHDRRSGLSHYLYGVSNLFISGTGIGGLSPMITGDEMGVNNILCLVLGAIAAFVFAYSANRVMKYNDK